MRLYVITIISILCINNISANNLDNTRAAGTINTINTFTYSSIQLPTGQGPPTATSTTIFQSQGILVYFCQTPLTTSPSDIAISLILMNRFGSRFCNQTQGQLILGIVMQFISNAFTSTWTQDLVSLGITASRFVVTYTTSGASINITAPSSKFSYIMMALRKMLFDIYAFSISSMQIDPTIDKMLPDLSVTALTTATNQAVMAMCLCQPQWDCGFPFINGLTSYFSIPLGSTSFYANTLLTTTKGTSNALSAVNLCFNLLYTERFLTFFIATNDTSILSTIPTEMMHFSNTFNTATVPAFQTTYYGYVSPPGLSVEAIRSTGTADSTGGIIYLGPISANSMVASALLVKLIRDLTVCSGSYTGTNAYTLIPVAGQMTVRLCSGQGAATISRQNWEIFLASLQARYANGANSADFSNTTYQNLITDVYNHFTIGSSRVSVSGDASNIASVLTATNNGYVSWMQLFQGAFNAMNDLANTVSTTNKATRLQNAAALVTAAAQPSATCEFNYLLA